MAGVEFALLFGLWMALVGNGSKLEMLVGVLAALIGAIANAVVKALGSGEIQAQGELIFCEPWSASSFSAPVWVPAPRHDKVVPS